MIPPYLYIIGGGNSTGALRSIERATVLDTAGNLGNWVQGVGSLNDARDLAGAVVIGSYLYVIGGEGNGANAGIERAQIMSDGTLGAFVRITAGLPVARYLPGVVLLGNQLFVMGGNDDDRAYATSIERATVNDNGTLGAFAVVPGATIMSSAGSINAVLENNLYVVGVGTPGAYHSDLSVLGP